MIRRTRIAALALLGSCTLAGCTMAPRYKQPDLPVPPSWPVGDAYLQQSETDLPRVSYRDIFADSRLQTLLDQALSNNRNLRVAAANVAVARGQYRAQRGALFPAVNLTDSVTRRDNGGSGAATGGGVVIPGSGATTLYSVNLGVTGYEIDLFGRIQSLTNAAQDRYFAQEAAARAARLSMVGELASAWAIYGADRALLKVAEETVASAERSVSLTRARLSGGIAPRTDLRQAEQILETARASIAEQKTAIAQDLNAIQLIVGAPVDPALLPDDMSAVIAAFRAPRAGLDSTVLLRRPDVVQAEYLLRAANAQIGAARAALFPRLTLTGVLGFASNALSSLFDSNQFNYSGTGSAAYSIFAGGTARAGLEVSKAQRDAALASYERAIQTAFRDVSDALARRGTIDEQLRANRTSVEASEDNFRLADARYRGGIDNFLTSLDAQRSLYNARRTLVNAQLANAVNTATLYTSLGGDDFSGPPPGRRPANEQ